MRFSKSYIKTLKETPKEAEDIHNALVSSRKVRETYGCTGIEWMEELYTELEKWRKRYE